MAATSEALTGMWLGIFGNAYVRRGGAIVALVGALAAAGCTPGKGGKVGPTSTPETTISTSASPTSRPELARPTTNLKLVGGQLVRCFTGGILLPEHTKLRDDQQIDGDRLAGRTMPAELQQRAHQATVRIQVRQPDGTLYDGSGTNIDDGQGGHWVATAGHLGFGTQAMSRFTVTDANGDTHKVDGGCTVYNKDGQPFALANANKGTAGIFDDVTILHVQGTIPGALRLANTPPQYGDLLYFSGYPVIGGHQGDQRYSGGCAQTFERDDTFMPGCAAHSGQSTGGMSGGAMLTPDGFVTGVLHGSDETPDVTFLGINGHVFGDNLVPVSYTGLDIVRFAIDAARQQQPQR